MQDFEVGDEYVGVAGGLQLAARHKPGKNDQKLV